MRTFDAQADWDNYDYSRMTFFQQYLIAGAETPTPEPEPEPTPDYSLLIRILEVIQEWFVKLIDALKSLLGSSGAQ